MLQRWDELHARQRQIRVVMTRHEYTTNTHNQETSRPSLNSNGAYERAQGGW
jgi:hypothetical protein